MYKNTRSLHAFKLDCISNQINLYTYGFINVIPLISIICRISQFTNKKLYGKNLSRDRMPCMRIAEILLLWQRLVAKDKLCGRATVLRSTVGSTAWQKFGTK
jgi:hypothetical protein